MDSLMRFAVLSPAARELANEGERERERERDWGVGWREGGRVEISRVVVCTRVRMGVKEDSEYEREEKARGMAAETHDERSCESFSRARHDTLAPCTLTLLQSVRRAHLRLSVVSREKQFSVCTSVRERDVSHCPSLFCFARTFSTVFLLKKRRLSARLGFPNSTKYTFYHCMLILYINKITK